MSSVALELADVYFHTRKPLKEFYYLVHNLASSCIGREDDFRTQQWMLSQYSFSS